MTAEQIAAYVGEVQLAGNTILATIETLDPEVAVPAEAAEVILALIAQMASKAIAAWGEASGVPITVESLQALLPNQTPLTAPDAPSGA